MKQSKVRVLLRLIRLVKPLTGFMLLAIFLGTCGFLSAHFIPILGAYAVINNGKMQLNTIFFLLILLALLRAVFRLGEQRTNHYIAFTLLAIIRDKVFFALRKLCPAKLEGRDRGDMIALITADVELLEVFYAHTISPIAIAFLTELIMLGFFASYHPAYALLALVSYLLIGVALPLYISKRSGTLGDELRGESAGLAALMHENIRGIDETIQYGAGEKQLRKMNDRTDALSGKQGKHNALTGTNIALANSLILISDTAFLFLAVCLFQSGSVDLEGVLVPLVAFMSSFGPVSALAALGSTLQTTIASGSRILAIIDEVPETEDIAGKEKTEFNGAELQDVHFSYGKETILNGVNAQFPKGKILGVVGKSGSGKSTMLKLLMRFWKTGSGKVLVSEKDIEEINTKDLRDMESYMTQETQLFKDTILNNVRIGRLDATDEEVIEACKKASLHDFIMTLPEGYQTQVGELGSTLSGGERQRISLARCFLHDADFLLLDEPTSNLDSLNEAIILRSLKEYASEKTVALVSHRTSTVRIADQVLSMEDGQIH